MAPAISTLVCLALFVTSLALSVPPATAYGFYGFGKDGSKRETNADRLARGLPPLRPRRLFDPSRTGPALARRSITPAVGFLAAYQTDGITPYCYITNAFTCDPNIVNAVQYTASVGAGDPSPQNLVTPINLPPPMPFDLVAHSTVDTLGLAGSGTVATISAMLNTQTAPFAGPTFNPVGSTYFESAIFTILPDGSISATWYNPTGSVPLAIPLVFFLESPAPNTLFATGDTTDAALLAGIPLTLKLLT